MSEIDLGGGNIALVDDDDLPKVSGPPWYAERRTTGSSYYARYNIFETGSFRTVYMHALIIERQKGLVIDHINGNGLDNRKANLRLLTPQQNLWNRPKDKGQIKGVRRARTGRWEASINHDGKHYGCGTYETQEEAASARDWVARLVRGDLAHTNMAKPKHFDLMFLPDAIWELLCRLDQDRHGLANKPGTSPHGFSPC